MSSPESSDQEDPRVRDPCDSETCAELRSAGVKIPDALLNGQASRIIQQTESRILTTLPSELILEIAGHLNGVDRTFLALSCKSMAKYVARSRLRAPSLKKHARFALRLVPCPQLERFIAYISPPDGLRLCCRCLAWIPTRKDYWLKRWPGLDERCRDEFQSAPRVRCKACKDRVCGMDHRCPRCNSSNPSVFVDEEEEEEEEGGPGWDLIRTQMEAWDQAMILGSD